MKRIALIAIAVLAATTGAASAYQGSGSGSRHGYNDGSDYRTEHIDRRRNRQYRAIFRSNAAGELTRRERERLFAEQNRITRMETAALRNRYMSRSEARKIGEAQNAARRHIRRESTDNNHRW